MLYSYRAAMLKRLGRLQEAESDLLLALSLVAKENTSVISDIYYNMACIHGIKNEVDEALKYIRLLKNINETEWYSIYLKRIQSHLDDYFELIKKDPEFIKEINSN